MSELYNKKKVMIIPSKQVSAAGGKCMTFDSIEELAAFFEVSYQYVSYKLYQMTTTDNDKKLKPWRGFYLDYCV